MRPLLLLTTAALLIGVTNYVSGQGNVTRKCIRSSNEPTATVPTAISGKPESQQGEITASPKTEIKEDSQSDQPVTEKQSSDEQAIRQAAELFVNAFDQGNAKTIATLFTEDAEYVDEKGNVFQGRTAIEKSMALFFAENPGCKLEQVIDTIRFLSPGVAVEDGHTTISHPEFSDAIGSRYTTVYVKQADKWLAASIRDHAPRDRKQHQSQLKQLDWLLGNWVDEANDSIINFTCQSVDNGNFLIRDFTVLMGGKKVLNGTQRIGWDPLTGKLRTWIFDSEGSYGEGLWHQDGDKWILKCTGVMPDGQSASSTSIYTIINHHTVTWQTVDHEIAGVRQPDSKVYTIVRQAPSPIMQIATEK